LHFCVLFLDTQPELNILRLIAGMGIKVIRRAAIELVALPQFAAYHHANGENGYAG